MAHIGARFKSGERVPSNGSKWRTPMSAVLKQCAVSAMAVAVLLLAGCSQSAKPSASDESEAAKQRRWSSGTRDCQDGLLADVHVRPELDYRSRDT